MPDGVDDVNITSLYRVWYGRILSIPEKQWWLSVGIRLASSTTRDRDKLRVSSDRIGVILQHQASKAFKVITGQPDELKSSVIVSILVISCDSIQSAAQTLPGVTSSVISWCQSGYRVAIKPQGSVVTRETQRDTPQLSRFFVDSTKN